MCPAETNGTRRAGGRHHAIATRIVLLLVTLLVGRAPLWAEEPPRFDNVSIQVPFDTLLKANPLLMTFPGATVIKLGGGRKALLAIASTAVNDGSAKDTLRMQRVCRNKALASLLAENKGVHVAYVSTVEEKTVVTIENGKETAKSIEEAMEVSRVSVEGMVRSLPVVGTWYSSDRKLFFMAFGAVVGGDQ